MDVTEHAQPLLGKGQQNHKYCFAAVTSLEWLCDFTSVVGREEAAERAAQFVCFGLIWSATRERTTILQLFSLCKALHQVETLLLANMASSAALPRPSTRLRTRGAALLTGIGLLVITTLL
ncbi:hypothetical protein BT96DRAFT_1102019, partial [Gymnopus androsaceus JB14]